jgi:hypothetical protein
MTVSIEHERGLFLKPITGFPSIFTFGKRLLKTQDLDPAYTALFGAKLPWDQLYRFLLSYWSYYHVGVAAYLSERQGDHYWAAMAVAAANEAACPHAERWPRGGERRHFRGEKCVRAVIRLAELYPRPEDAVERLLELNSAGAVMDAVKAWPMFSNWAAFKAADMLERCAGFAHQIAADVVLLYDAPRAGLELVASEEGITAEACWSQLLEHFAAFPAPPANDRPCGPAEVESILCKHKSMRSGHYRVGRDISEHRNALHGWGATAERLAKAYPAFTRF